MFVSFPSSCSEMGRTDTPPLLARFPLEEMTTGDEVISPKRHHTTRQLVDAVDFGSLCLLLN